MQKLVTKQIGKAWNNEFMIPELNYNFHDLNFTKFE